MGKAGLMPRRKQSKARTKQAPKASKGKARRTPYHLETAPDFRELLRETSSACRAKGFSPDDLDYAAVISAAVLRAADNYDSSKATGSLTRLCVHYALNRCRSIAKRKRHSREIALGIPKDDSNGFTVEDTALASTDRETPIDPVDFELLSYVAAVGRKQASIDLGISSQELRDTLLRIKATVEKQS